MRRWLAALALGGLAVPAAARDEAELNPYLRDPARLVELCGAETFPSKTDRALNVACGRLQDLRDRAYAERLDTDDAAYAALCPAVITASDWYQGCEMARDRRSQREARVLLADPVSLDKKCSALGEDRYRRGGLSYACTLREGQIRDAEQARLAADDAAYARECADADPSPAVVVRPAGQTDHDEICALARQDKQFTAVRYRLGEPEKLKVACARDEKRSEELVWACDLLGRGNFEYLALRPGESWRAVPEQTIMAIPVREEAPELVAAARAQADAIVTSALAGANSR